jgi:hypothetical protein
MKRGSVSLGPDQLGAWLSWLLQTGPLGPFGPRQPKQGRRFPLSPSMAHRSILVSRWPVASGGMVGEQAHGVGGPYLGCWMEWVSSVRAHGDDEHSGRGRGRRRYRLTVASGEEGAIDKLQSRAVLLQALAWLEEVGSWRSMVGLMEESGGAVNSLARRCWLEARAGRQCYLNRGR